MLEYIDGKKFKDMFVAGARRLQENRELVDSLNVFPVPDGDTGTNMSLTLDSALKQLDMIKLDNLKQVADALSNGTLMGARGNSGVILSQFFRGLAKGAGQRDKLNAIGLARALDRAVKTVYQAGGFKPVEGTIITVAREAAKAAWNKARVSNDVIEVCSAVLETAEVTLAQTPNMLPVLREAGVVDAGGQGLVFILAGALDSLQGKENNSHFSFQHPIVEKMISTRGVIEFTYCTEFIIKGKQINLQEIEKHLCSLGDCLLVVGSPEIVKVHLHTNNPGVILDYALKWGQLSSIQISNMEEQKQEKETNIALKEIGIVAVVAGQGLTEMFSHLGCDLAVEGGQTMNPSTQELLAAVEQVRAKKVFVLPNNKNVILAAQQLVGLAKEKEVVVIPSKTIPQGLAALLSVHDNWQKDDLHEKMQQAIKQVKSAEITYAIRECTYQGKNIKIGDILAIWEDEIVVVGNSLPEVIEQMLKEKLDEEVELITIFSGEKVKQEEAEDLVEILAQKYPQLELELHRGDQPHYYYLLSIE